LVYRWVMCVFLGYDSSHFIFLFFFLLLCWLRVHCGIHKCSYNMSNISYLNSPFHHSVLLPLSPSTSWNSFNRTHFHIYSHQIFKRVIMLKQKWEQLF
jgi:hypothetical protein